VAFVVGKVAMGQVFLQVLQFFPVNFIPRALQDKEKRKKKLVVFITVLHSEPQGCGTSVASAAGRFTPKKSYSKPCKISTEAY
jgi:hypothetical protein